MAPGVSRSDVINERKSRTYKYPAEQRQLLFAAIFAKSDISYVKAVQWKYCLHLRRRKRVVKKRAYRRLSAS